MKTKSDLKIFNDWKNTVGKEKGSWKQMLEVM